MAALFAFLHHLASFSLAARYALPQALTPGTGGARGAKKWGQIKISDTAKANAFEPEKCGSDPICEE